MDSIINFIITKTWKSDYFRSWVLAQARVLAATATGGLALHGYITNDIQQQIIGIVASLVVYYLQNLDVRLVDGKIKIALNTPVPGQTTQVTQTATSNDMTGNTLTTVKVETKPLGDIPK